MKHRKLKTQGEVTEKAVLDTRGGRSRGPMLADLKDTHLGCHLAVGIISKLRNMVIMQVIVSVRK